MRADRLLSLLLLLQTRGRMTADRLADELEVSVRTVYRDVYALRVAGFPVYSERGLGGGCYLHEDYRIKLTDLTQDELAALFAMAVPTPLADLGVGQEARGALLKLAAALPVARRGIEQHVRTRIHLDPEPWNPRRDLAPTLSTLRQGVWSDQWMKVTFLRVRGITIDREIAPYGLVAKAMRWYVIWLGREDGLHVDRASSIVQAELLEEQFVRDDAFDLGIYWSDWSRRHQANRSTFQVAAQVKEDVMPVLARELGAGQISHAEPTKDSERVSVNLMFEHLDHARSVLLALGAAVEVTEPEALRRSMADFGHQIEATYSQSSLP